MLVFPNSKINLGLNVVRKRTDGYHDIETIFYPIPLNDALEIVEHKQAGQKFSLPFSSSGLSIEGDASSNLCLKAYRLLKKDFPHIPVKGVDERYTSKLASQAMLEMGLKKKQRREKGLVDKIAATIILQEYLRSRST